MTFVDGAIILRKLWVDAIEQLTETQAGILLKHIYQWAWNPDDDYQIDDPTVAIMFEMMKYDIEVEEP